MSSVYIARIKVADKERARNKLGTRFVVCSFSRRRKGRIASYVTLSATKKTGKIQR